MTRFSDNDGSMQQMNNPWLDRAGGAVVGAGGVMAYNAVHSAKVRANWALGIALGLAALTLFNSGALQSDMNNAAAAAIAFNQLTFTAAGATGAEVAALRAQCTNLANIVAKLAYDCNIWNFFQNQPAVQPVSIPAAAGAIIPAIPAIGTVQSNNNNILILAVVAVGIAVLALS
jgi:hypothetical protein